jgi:hypothetical protein
MDTSHAVGPEIVNERPKRNIQLPSKLKDYVLSKK